MYPVSYTEEFPDPIDPISKFLAFLEEEQCTIGVVLLDVHLSALMSPVLIMACHQRWRVATDHWWGSPPLWSLVTIVME